MGWADNAIEKLEAGETVVIKPTGNSMSPIVKSGAKVTLSPVKAEDIEKGDVVLCKVRGRQYLHLVEAITENRYLIKNNRGHTNGWTGIIYGKATKIEN